VITDELYDLLIDPTGPTAGGRIFTPDTPENYTYVGPYLVISGVGGTSEEDLTGGIGVANERFQFSCRAKVEDGGNLTCRSMAEQIRVTLQGVAAQDGKLIEGASVASRGIDLYDSNLNLHVVLADYEVWYSEQPTSAPD